MLVQISINIDQKTFKILVEHSALQNLSVKEIIEEIVVSISEILQVAK